MEGQGSNASIIYYLNSFPLTEKTYFDMSKFIFLCNSTDVGVTLFDDFAKQFEEAIKNIGSGNKFVIISSAKIGKFQGKKK